MKRLRYFPVHFLADCAKMTAVTLKHALIIFFFCSGSLYSQVKADDDFDFFLLAQFWPPSSCIYFENEGVECEIPSGVDGWTIHGLWPSIPGTTNPQYCNDSMKFDFSEIKLLENDLIIDWPNYDAEEAEDYLWEHEWDKHGTCAYSVPQLRGEYNYFSGTLQLHSKLDTLGVLQKFGIVPSDTAQYTPDDIFNALKSGYGTIPNIVCEYDKATTDYHVDQIYLCYSKDLQMIDCPEVASSTLLFKSMKERTPKLGSYYNDCPSSGGVYYKPIPA